MSLSPHVYLVDAQLSLCTDVDSQFCTSMDPDLSNLVVAAPLSPRRENRVPHAHRTPWFEQCAHVGSGAGSVTIHR